MEINIVRLSDFTVGGLRLGRIDAEFVLPSLMRWERAAAAKAGDRLGTVCGAYDGQPVTDALHASNEVVDYVAIDNVDTSDGLVLPTQVRFEDRPSRAKYVVRAGDLLVSNVRPNRGGVALASRRIDGALASSGFTLLRRSKPPASAVSAEFLFAFLRSRFGRDQLIRRNRGSMYPAVLPDDVRDLWIPAPPDALAKAVGLMVKEGLGLHDEFFAEESRQVAALREYLRMTVGPPPPSPLERDEEAGRYSVRSINEFFGPDGAARFDAEFFRSEYQEFNERISRLKSSFLLGDRYRCFAGRSPGEEVSEILYLKQSVLTNHGINWSAAEVEMGNPEPNGAGAKPGDILMACTAHEIYYVARKVDYVRHVPEAAADSNVCVADIMILRPKAANSVGVLGAGPYVAAFLRSAWGLHQVQRCIRGLRGGHVYGSDIERYVRVPEPDLAWLRDFERRSSKAEESRNRARAAIKDAIKMIEDWAGGLDGDTIARRRKYKATVLEDAT